ncbi:hypothetical protein M433DRAFT_82746 [Acidomyces richmondensis BFW]|nr:hypothetical protein M433DRAFT_82746 [Acidomyces richmondensis BFW]
MASDADNRPSLTVAELVAYTKKELDADAERQAKVSAAGGGGLESQTGATLDLSHKKIYTLPVEVITLIKDKVERLALSHNPQISVPPQIVQCDRLRYLNIRWNNLKYFPEAVCQLSSLEILDLSKNRIVSIPESIKNMTSLKFLAIAKNKITRLPLALGDMPSLSKLKFDENPIEFPPPDAIKPMHNYMSTSIESEKDICQQVKRFLKAASLREKLRTTSEEDMSESNVETPRPPKRTATVGRFPIRPSISKIENLEELKNRSPNDAPPIPQRSHARNMSSNAQAGKRPTITPLVTSSNDINRSRSETVASSTSLRARRQGFVPRKTVLESNSIMETASNASSRSSQASTIKPSHSRGNSVVSFSNGLLSANSGEISSATVSPVDGPFHRYGTAQKLSSLPENRHLRIQPSNSGKAAKRMRYPLYQLHVPLNEVLKHIKEGTPKRRTLERQMFTAHAHLEELETLTNRLDTTGPEDTNDINITHIVRSLILNSIAALKAVGGVVKELKQHTYTIVAEADPVLFRCLMLQTYAAILEFRNTCTLLDFKIITLRPHKSLRVSPVWNSRTVTPTQSQPISNRRVRGSNPLQSMKSKSSLRNNPPPVTLHTHGSGTSALLSSSSATPRSSESFSALPSSTLPPRSNTARGVVDDGDNDDHFGPIFLKLTSACELAGQSLPRCRTEFAVRKKDAENSNHVRLAHHWALALSRCEAVIAANNSLMHRLKLVRLKDPSVRSQRDFWQLCDSFVQSWTDLATELKDLSQQRVDISTVRTVMRPVQKAVKEVSKTISESPLYHHAVRPGMPPVSAGLQTLAPAFPSHVNMPYTHGPGSSGLQPGYITPVPPTPLSAALGPAIQATVATAPNTAPLPPEHYQHGLASSGFSGRHDRGETTLQLPNYGRR